MDNEDLCKKILKIDHVRFAGICDETGEISSMAANVRA